MAEVERKGIEKAKVGLAVCAVVVVILASFNVWLYTEYESYVTSHQYTNSEYESYVANHPYTDSQYEEAKFYFYYVRPKDQKFGVSELADDLVGLVWIEPYQEGVFDCSEMSAYMERYLENKGWNAKIVGGDFPVGSGSHSWLLVETSQGQYMPVESTSIRVVFWGEPYFNNYFNYDHAFETIQEAIAYNESEFDWWK